MLKYRILTALVLIPLVMIGIFYASAVVYGVILTAVMAYAAWEWSNLMRFDRRQLRILYTLAVLLTLPIIALIPVGIVLLASVGFWFCATIFLFRYPLNSQWWANSLLVQGLMGVFVIAPCWLAMYLLRLEPAGALVTLMLLLFVWGADIGAYFAGRAWGKDKFIPAVSPGKTLQGLYGGLLMNICISAAFAYFHRTAWLGFSRIAFLALITFAAAVIGDLMISMMKRSSGVKDTGTLLPGHGGLLDRIDSLMAAAPIFFLGWIFLR